MIGIKDIEMPKSCMECEFCIDPEIDWMCLLTKNYVNSNSMNINVYCPLIEIKEGE